MVVEKQIGAWTNDGSCVGIGADKTCGPGYQMQKRTCTNIATDKCSAADTEKTILCKDAGTALPECPDGKPN